ELEPNGDLLGEFTSFVGEIQKDDVATGVFDLTVAPEASPGPRTVTARVIYTDEQGVESSSLKTFDLFISEPAGRSGTSIAAAALLLAGLLIYLWRRRKRELAEA
ncbi:MAG: LPXTG cell wall anchor domain-containing protein, partial [Methanobacteriota archaeon]